MFIKKATEKESVCMCVDVRALRVCVTCVVCGKTQQQQHNTHSIETKIDKWMQQYSFNPVRALSGVVSVIWLLCRESLDSEGYLMRESEK